VAGVVTPTRIAHRDRGIVRTDAVVTCDASGDATATVVGVGFGRLVGVGLKFGTFDIMNTIVTVKDAKTGATLFSYDTDNEKYTGTIGTVTGDDTGGASPDIFTSQNNHLFAAGDKVRLYSLTAGAGTTLVAGTYYWVHATGLAAKTFCVSATAGGGVLNIGTDAGTTDDVSASVWGLISKANGTLGTGRWFRPTGNVTVAAGTAITGADTAPNVNRDIFVAGKVTVTVAQGGNLGAGAIALVVDETGVGLGEPLTV